MTKKEMFVAIREKVLDNQEMVDFLDHQVELLNKKASGTRKPTKVQIENDGFKADILTVLASADEPVTIKGLCEICPSIADLTNQKITHLLTDLRKDGKVARTYVKKVAYFSLGSEG